MTDIKPKFIEIDGGRVTSIKIKDAYGERFAHYDGDPMVFFIDLVEQDGSRIGLWSGTDYIEAVREAELCRREWGIDEPVHDLIAGGVS